jgi:hypothetical protein
MATCPNCQKQIPEADHRFCQYCRHDHRPEMVMCPHGDWGYHPAMVSHKPKYCVMCGAQMPQPAA